MSKNTTPHTPPRVRTRTTISLTPVIAAAAGEMMEKKGFNNFSAYVADLIRRHKEQDQRNGEPPKRRRQLS
jgi:hypothetical protein